MPNHPKKESGKPPWSKNIHQIPKNFTHGLHPYESNIVLALPAISQHPTHNGKANKPPTQCLDDDNCTLEEPCTQMQKVPILNPSPPKSITIDAHVFQTMVEMGLTNFLLDGTKFLNLNNPSHPSQPLVISVDQGNGKLTSTFEGGENSTTPSMASLTLKNNSTTLIPPKDAILDARKNSQPKKGAYNRIVASPPPSSISSQSPLHILPQTTLNNVPKAPTQCLTQSGEKPLASVDSYVEELTLDLVVAKNPTETPITHPSPKNNPTTSKSPKPTTITTTPPPHPENTPTTRNSSSNQTLGLDYSHFPPLASPNVIPNHAHTLASSSHVSTIPTIASSQPNTPSPSMTPTPTPVTKPSPFASLFKQNRISSKCEPLTKGTKVERIKVRDESLLSIQEAWGNSLIGYLVGLGTNGRILSALLKLWGVPCQYSIHKNGWVVFTFQSKEHMEEVLQKGPYSSFGRQWIIKTVPKLFSFSDACFSSVPIWVNLHKLPKQCWSNSILSAIGTQLGTPVCMDLITSDRIRHETARILVEVDISQDPVMMVELEMPDGRIWEQPIEYEILPYMCAQCHRLGHKTEECKPRRPVPPRSQSVDRRGRETSRMPVPKAPVSKKGKEKVTEAEGNRSSMTVQHDIVRPAGIMIPDPTERSTAQDLRVVTPPPPRRHIETSTPRVDPNPFAVLAGSDGRSGSTRAVVQIEEDDTPLMIHALLDDVLGDDDLLDDEGADDTLTRHQAHIEDKALDASLRVSGGRRRRRRADAQ